MTARVVALHASTASRVALVVHERVDLLEERGIQGDRHAKKNSRRQVLLVEKEVLDELKLEPGELREQVTVEGLDLNGLVFGARLRCGSAVLEVAGPCAPCERMDEIRDGLQTVLEGRRGRFVRVVGAGRVAVGDAIYLESSARV